jgi:DNA-binding Xre family transcriptional regulator
MAKSARERRVTMALAGEIRAVAARQGLKAVDLAAATGYARSSMAKIWNGESAIDVDQLARICRPLGVQPYDLLALAMKAVEATADVDDIIDAADLSEAEKQRIRDDYAAGIAVDHPDVTDDHRNHSNG